LVVSGKKRNFAVKLDVELNEWRMKQVEERYISLLTDKVFDRLFEEAEIAKFTPQEMREYEASKMAYRDIKNSIDTAKQEGLAEGMEKGMELGIEKGMKKGMEKGLEKGMKKGMNQKALDIARNMLADGVDINLIMKYSGLTQEQIEKLK
jgi:flagellar biosynthesis/type III secretory pathway protein FliH